jgi:hypothetical protein
MADDKKPPQEYPRMVYHDEGRSQIVQSEQEESDLGSGWNREPNEKHFDWHFNQPNHFRTRVPIQDPNKVPDKPASEDLTARISQLERLLMEAGQRRPPGRPPGSVNRNSSIEGEQDNG